MNNTHTGSDLTEVVYFPDIERIESPMIGFPGIVTPGSTLEICVCAGRGLPIDPSKWRVQIISGVRRIRIGNETTIDDGTYSYRTVSLLVEDVQYPADFEYNLAAVIPPDCPVDLYDLTVEASGKLLAQENAVQVISSFSSEPTFLIVSDPHIGFKGYPCIDEPNIDEISIFANLIREVNRLRPDFAVICGDLVDWSCPGNWENLSNLLKLFQVPIYTIVGNHDYYWDNWWDGYPPLLPAQVRCDRVALRYYLRHINPLRRFGFDYGPLHAACLDSGDDAVLAAVEAYGSGLSDEDLRWLKNNLDGRERSFVFMHHPATRAGAKLDFKRDNNVGCITRNRLEFMNLCSRCRVAAVFSGHEHVEERWSQDGVDYHTSPSVARSGDDNGYRRVRLTPDGGFHTEVVRFSSGAQSHGLGDRQRG